MQDLTNELHSRVKETVPNVKKAEYTGWKLVSDRVKKGRKVVEAAQIALQRKFSK